MICPLPRVESGRTLADRVTESLHLAILDGHFALGERLDPQRIAEELDVSPMPVREAIRRLESTGLIVNHPHRGVFVLDLTPNDIREVYSIRLLLEAEVVREVTPIIPEAVLDDLDALLRANQTRVEADDLSTHYDTDVRFHGTLLEHSHNRLMRELLGGLTDRIGLVRRFGQSHRGAHITASLVEHRRLLDAIRRRDVALAVKITESHLRESMVRIGSLAERGDLQPIPGEG